MFGQLLWILGVITVRRCNNRKNKAQIFKVTYNWPLYLNKLW
jgi:hypothetical protein